MFNTTRFISQNMVRTSSPRFSNISTLRQFTTTAPTLAWEGRKPEENSSREPDSHNAQIDAVKEGKESRAKNDGKDSAATSEKDDGNMNEKAKRDHPEAPSPVIGMNDERGGKGY